MQPACVIFLEDINLRIQALSDTKAIAENAHAALAQICSDAYPDVVVTPPSISGLHAIISIDNIGNVAERNDGKKTTLHN